MNSETILTIKLTNTTKSPQKVKLFNANLNYLQPNYGIPKGVDVFCDMDYHKLLMQLIAMPLRAYFYKCSRKRLRISSRPWETPRHYKITNGLLLNMDDMFNIDLSLKPKETFEVLFGIQERRIIDFNNMPKFDFAHK